MNNYFGQRVKQIVDKIELLILKNQRLNMGINIKGHYTALSLPKKIDLYNSIGNKHTFTLSPENNGTNYYNIFYPEIGFALIYCIYK